MNVRQSAALATLAFLAACADGTSPGSKLSSDEAVALAMALNSQASSAGSAQAMSANRLPTSGASFNMVPQPVSASVDVSAPCPRGGTNHLVFNLSAQVDDQAQSMTADMTGTQSPAACGFDAKNVVVNITGTPSLTHTSHLEVTAGQPTGTWTSSLKGSFDYSTSDDRSGSCSVDWTTSANFTTHRITISGKFCGATFNYDGPIPQAPAA